MNVLAINNIRKQNGEIENFHVEKSKCKCERATNNPFRYPRTIISICTIQKHHQLSIPIL